MLKNILRLLMTIALASVSVRSMKINENVRSVHVVFSHHLDVGLDFMPNKTVTDCGVRNYVFYDRSSLRHSQTAIQVITLFTIVLLL